MKKFNFLISIGVSLLFTTCEKSESPLIFLDPEIELSYLYTQDDKSYFHGIVETNPHSNFSSLMDQSDYKIGGIITLDSKVNKNDDNYTWIDFRVSGDKYTGSGITIENRVSQSFDCYIDHSGNSIGYNNAWQSGDSVLILLNGYVELTFIEQKHDEELYKKRYDLFEELFYIIE